jgi:hypothetical protein
MAIVGGLGSGKTASLTYLAWRNHNKGVKIYSNYNLKGIPYKPVNTVEDIISMKKGFFAGDELWIWLDSRASMKRKNMLIGNILLTSRKKDVQIAFTTQTFGQIDLRIRRITDFIAVPQMNANDTMCRLLILSNPSFQPLRTYKFKTKPIFDLYDTREIIRSLDDDDG